MTDEQGSLLIVDDDEFFRKLIQTVIERSGKFPGLKFLQAKDGQEAWELIQEHQPQVVILDIVMPKMGGIELTELIKESYPNTKVLVMTGEDNPEHRQALIERLGVDSYNLKDQDIANLTHEVLRLNPFKFY